MTEGSNELVIVGTASTAAEEAAPQIVFVGQRYWDIDITAVVEAAVVEHEQVVADKAAKELARKMASEALAIYEACQARVDALDAAHKERMDAIMAPILDAYNAEMDAYGSELSTMTNELETAKEAVNYYLKRSGLEEGGTLKGSTHMAVPAVRRGYDTNMVDMYLNEILDAIEMLRKLRKETPVVTIRQAKQK